MSLLLLGPGTTITHDAVMSLADNGCAVGWCGEQSVRFYAFGSGLTRSAEKAIKQARLVSDDKLRRHVVRRMYQMRFDQELDESLTIQQIRGMEGVRVRETYAVSARRTGVAWSGREYKRTSWKESDTINRALSAANACLYGVCQAAIVALGYSPALGFIHTGKHNSFVLDIADLYKADVTVPIAFDVVARNRIEGISRTVRLECRDIFHKIRLLDLIPRDIANALNVESNNVNQRETKGLDLDEDSGEPSPLWDDQLGSVGGGTSYRIPPKRAG